MPTADTVWTVSRDNAVWSAPSLADNDGRIALALRDDLRPGQQLFLKSGSSVWVAYATPLVDQIRGTTEGYLLAAREISPFVLNEISPLAEQPAKLLLPGDTSVAPAAAVLRDPGLTPEEQFDVEQEAGYTVARYDDAFGEPLFALAVDSPRFSTTLAGNPGVSLFLWITGITLIYVLVMGIVIERFVGAPLQRLKQRMMLMNDGELPVGGSNQDNDIANVEQMLVTLADEREKRESSLRYFASAVEAADDAIAIIDWQGSLHYVNPGCERLTGYSSDELIANQNWWGTVFATNTMNYRSRDEDNWEGEVQVRRADGSIRFVEAKTYKLDQTVAKKAYFVLVMHDITETTNQIAEIQRLATAVKSIEDCIIIADNQGCISYANPAYEKRCGKPLSEMLGQQTNKLSHAASPLKVYEDLQQTVLRGEVWRGELQAVFQDGRRVIDEAVVSPVVNERGEIVNFVTTLHDVTERVTMEEDLRLARNRAQQANDKLEERVLQRTEELREAKEVAEQANVAKSAFLATVSHEIRTPLNGILGMLELLRDHPLDNEQRRLLSSADTSASLLLTLINDILDFSKIEAGELVIDETPVSLREVTESVILSLAGNAHRRKLRLQSTLQPELPEIIMVDGVRLQQILLNLLGNALKFTSSDNKQGIVTLTVDRGPEQHGSPTLRLRVTDNGIGIPDEALGSLFKPFTQAESSTTRRFGGTGLGLTISSRLAQLMGGEITVESKLGEGSQFTVILPLTEAVDATSSSSLPTLTADKTGSKPSIWDENYVRGHILVAEDNPINQEVIKLQLKAIGFSCDLAADGHEALTLWRENDYDLILTDCHMPNMDGFELARAVRAGETGSEHVPIVALTANVLSEEAERCRQAGMEECLTKPIERRALDRSLSVHLTARALERAVQPDDEALEGEQPAAAETTEEAPLPFTGEGLLDMQVFAASIGDDREVQCELLRRFADEAAKNLTECRHAFDADDATALECNAHKLKSAARTLGAERLADVCVEIERAARDNDLLIIGELLEQKARLIELLDTQIKAELAAGEKRGTPAPA